MDTMRGVLENYNELRSDPELVFDKDDLIVFLISDGYSQLSEKFKTWAKERKFFDQDYLKMRGFCDRTKQGEWYMKDVELLVEDVENVPNNLLHLFMVSTWDFGLGDSGPKTRRIQFVFGVKQRNDGKINSHKWFYNGICKYLNPEFCMLLDIGTRPQTHSLYKLLKY